MNYIKPDVATICIGMAASGGAWLLSAGTKGKRYALANSEIMIHQPLGGEADHLNRSDTAESYKIARYAGQFVIDEQTGSLSLLPVTAWGGPATLASKLSRKARRFQASTNFLCFHRVIVTHLTCRQ